MTQIEIDQIRVVKRAYAASLMSKANVIGVGVGYAWQDGKKTDQLALVVLVSKKVPSALLSPDDLLPSEIDGVLVDVQEAGELKAQK